MAFLRHSWQKAGDKQGGAFLIFTMGYDKIILQNKGGGAMPTLIAIDRKQPSVSCFPCLADSNGCKGAVYQCGIWIHGHAHPFDPRGKTGLFGGGV